MYTVICIKYTLTKHITRTTCTPAYLFSYLFCQHTMQRKNLHKQVKSFLLMNQNEEKFVTCNWLYKYCMLSHHCSSCDANTGAVTDGEKAHQ